MRRVVRLIISNNGKHGEFIELANNMIQEQQLNLSRKLDGKMRSDRPLPDPPHAQAAQLLFQITTRFEKIVSVGRELCLF